MAIIDNPLFVGLFDLIPIIIIVSIVIYIVKKKSGQK
jgi:hypothetical protein